MADTDMEAAIIKIASGSKADLEKLYISFNHAVYALSLSITRSPSLAEDVSQEVFLKIWTNAGTYRPGENPGAWIMGIARNAAIDLMRKRKANTISIDDIINTVPDTAGFEENITDCFTLKNALQSLDDDIREIVVLRAITGLPAAEVSKITKTPLNTVYWKYHKGIRLLAKAMKGVNCDEKQKGHRK